LEENKMKAQLNSVLLTALRALLCVSFGLIGLIGGVACYAQEPAVKPEPLLSATDDGTKNADTQNAASVPAPVETVIVSVAGLYGDWKMVLPEFPRFDKPIIGDFCNLKKLGENVSIICADGFLQEIPEVTFNADKLRLRWGGAFNHTIYDAVLKGNGTFDGEIIQAQMGLVSHRFKARMERVSAQPVEDAPQQSLTVLNNYFDDLASKSIREKYYEDSVYRSMKKAVAKRAYPHVGFTVEYFGKILEDKGHGATYPDVFKVSNGEKTEQWCLVRVDAQGLVDVRCSDIR
jgi:hypothetical protein